MNIEELSARRQVVELISKYARGIDTKNWTAVSEILTDKIDVDYSQATGQPPAAEMTRDELVAVLKKLLDRADIKVQTLTTNHIVEANAENAASVSDFFVVHRTTEGKSFEVRRRYAVGFRKITRRLENQQNSHSRELGGRRPEDPQFSLAFESKQPHI